MTDTHTHILPGMDDGAANCEQSLLLLKQETAQGVDHVIFTPHFYPEREDVRRFLTRRAAAEALLREAIDALPETERAELPSYGLGAEVAWVPWLAELPELQRLCYEETRLLMLELPMPPWGADLISNLLDFMNTTGLTPVIAHIDRYLRSQKKLRLEELFSLGLPAQISASAFSEALLRRKALALVKSGQVQFLISDCHHPERRSPHQAKALSVIEKHLGAEAAERLRRSEVRP